MGGHSVKASFEIRLQHVKPTFSKRVKAVPSIKTSGLTTHTPMHPMLTMNSLAHIVFFPKLLGGWHQPMERVQKHSADLSHEEYLQMLWTNGSSGYKASVRQAECTSLHLFGPQAVATKLYLNTHYTPNRSTGCPFFVLCLCLGVFLLLLLLLSFRMRMKEADDDDDDGCHDDNTEKPKAKAATAAMAKGKTAKKESKNKSSKSKQGTAKQQKHKKQQKQKATKTKSNKNQKKRHQKQQKAKARKTAKSSNNRIPKLNTLKKTNPTICAVFKQSPALPNYRNCSSQWGT